MEKTESQNSIYLEKRQKKWLPDLDLNQDKLNQNQLCYRYTIRQTFCLWD